MTRNNLLDFIQGEWQNDLMFRVTRDIMVGFNNGIGESLVIFSIKEIVVGKNRWYLTGMTKET